MRRRLIMLPAAALLAAGCTSFADDPGSAPTTSASTGATSSSGAAGLAVSGSDDLGTAAGGVTGARLATGDGGPAVLLTGSDPALVVDGEAAPVDAGALDVALVDGDPVVVELVADPVSGDPVLAVHAAGRDADPVELDPAVTVPRGVPVLAAAGDGEVLLLVEGEDRVSARVLAVDPATGDVRRDVDLDLGTGDLGTDDVESLDLVGLAATGGGVVAAMGVLGADGTTTGLLVRLDGDLRPDGDPQEADGELLALTADGTPVTADDDGTVRVDGDAVTGDLRTRVSGAAAADGTPVVAFLDQDSPTVVVGTRPLQLCDGDGDALAVAAQDDGTVLVAGTCDGDSVLWTLG